MNKKLMLMLAVIISVAPPAFAYEDGYQGGAGSQCSRANKPDYSIVPEAYNTDSAPASQPKRQQPRDQQMVAAPATPNQ